MSSPEITHREPDYLNGKAHDGGKTIVVEIPAHSPSEWKRDDSRWPSPTGEFFRGLSVNARLDFDLLSTNFRCPSSRILISEQEKSVGILFLLEGQVAISMNSSDGRRFLLGVAPGDTLGLLLPFPAIPPKLSRSEVSLQDCINAPSRLSRLPLALSHRLSKRTAGVKSAPHASLCEIADFRPHFNGICETSRSVARVWCKTGEQTESGTKIRLAFTHGEIGECIGTSRESVTRTLKDLKNQYLVIQRGSTLIVPSRDALANYAGVDSIPDDPNQPAAA